MIASPRWRKTVLLLHVTTGTGLMGAVAAFLALALAGEATAQVAVYSSMRIITWQIIVPLALASLLSGIVGSLTTPWGLVRHYWVGLKLALTLLAVIVLLLQTGTINALAAGRALPGAGAAMILHSAGGLIVLLGIMVLSIYKPRGVTGLSF